MSVKIILADDHPIVRDGLRGVISAQPALEIIAETGDGLAVLPLVKKYEPALIILDLVLPGIGGLEIARQIQRAAVRTQVIILSMHATEAYVAEALQAGAQAYVLKRSASSDLIAAINAVLQGRKYLSPPLSENLLENYQQLAIKDSSARQKTLTFREQQILYLVTEGLTNRQIAQRLSLSPRTVEMHRANLMKKLRFRSTAELVRFAIERGIQPPGMK